MSKYRTEEQLKTENKEVVDMLIRFYNIQTGCSFRFSPIQNRQAVLNALDFAEIKEVKDFIREWVKVEDNKLRMCDCFNTLAIKKMEEKEKAQAVEENQVPYVFEKPTESQTMGAMEMLSKVVVDMLAKTKEEQIEKQVLGSVEQKVKEFIEKEYGHIEKKVTTVVDGKKVEVEGVVHEKFEQICQFVANDIPVFLTGEAGCGKNVLCQQVAKSLGLDFYFSNAVTQEYKITGFTDAMGVFHETQFYKAFKNGGLFMLDEMDASIPEVLVILNAAIANRYFDFPAPIGYVKAHENFRIISAGNTFGQGADFEYVGRNQLDMASLDRFAMVKMTYSPQIELAVAKGNKQLVDFCRDFRKQASKNGIKVVVSYRGIGNIAKLQDLMGIKEALKTCLIKGLEKDDVNMIVKGLKDNVYSIAVKEIANEMGE